MHSLEVIKWMNRPENIKKFRDNKKESDLNKLYIEKNKGDTVAW